MAKFWARVGVTLEIDENEVKGKTLEEVSELLKSKLNDFKIKANTKTEYIDGDSYFPSCVTRQTLIELGLIDQGMTETEIQEVMPLEFDL